MADVAVNTRSGENDAAVAAYRWAQAEYFRAQTAGQLIDNITAQALASSAEIALKREQLKESWEAAANGRNRAYHFTDNVSPDSVEPAIDVLNRWSRLDGDNQRPWSFVICSNGGSVVAGMKLYATLKAVAAQRPLVTVASGICASMATVLHQTGTTRLIEPGCSYMIHDVSGVADGSITNMQDTMDWMGQLNGQLHMFLAEKSGKSVEEIAEMSKRRDAWYMPADVVAHGFADKIGYATEATT